MPLPRPPGSGVEKILVSSNQIPEDHVLHLVVFTCRSSEPGVGFFASRPRFLFLLGCSPPRLSLTPLRAPLPFSPGCPAVSSKVSHLITIVTLHLGGVSTLFPLCAVVPVSWGKGWFLILLVSWRRFIISQSKSSLRPQSCRCVHRISIGYRWTRWCKESPQVVRFGGTGPKPF